MRLVDFLILQPISNRTKEMALPRSLAKGIAQMSELEVYEMTFSCLIVQE